MAAADLNEFSPVPLDAELLGPSAEGHTATETSYFGFSVPDAGIDCLIYHWIHPQPGVLSGGVAIWSTFARWMGEADHLDYRNYLPCPQSNLDDVRYPTGVHVTVIEPFRRISVEYCSPTTDVEFAVQWDAIAEPAGKPGGGNFTQPMRTSGSLRLNGREHTVAGYFTRNRSFQVTRGEDAPFRRHTWSAPIFGEDLAFLIVAEDTTEMSVQALQWGYVAVDGQLRQLRSVRQVTQYAHGFPDHPVTITIELRDHHDEIWLLQGTAVSSLPVPYWPMLHANLTFMRWTLPNGRVGYGDCQDMLHANNIG
ncbi:DUF7064 domain-containing protein [Mycobacterium sp. NPDC003323]